MKKQLFSLILAGFLLSSICLLAQSKNYPTKKIKGIEYYVYKVEVSEGLLAIGRKFDISVDEINKANPDLNNDLKVGQKILIPIDKNVSTTSQNEVTSNIEFELHEVKKKQTLFAISKKYEVSQEEIKKHNPQIENGLQVGMILQIPKQVKEKKKTEVEKAGNEEIKIQPKEKVSSEKSYKIHIVQTYETLYSISKKYQVEIVEIIKLNPTSATSISIGMELKIPTNKETSITLNQKDDSINATYSASHQANFLIKKNDNSILPTKKMIKIAFLLPFMLEQDKTDASNERFIEFYAGSLIAIEEAKNKGISFEIYTYDTEKSEEKIKEVLTNSELKTMDFIVGPAFSNQISFVAEFAKEHKINTLIPFSSKVPDIENNAYLFQFNPGKDVELKFSTEILLERYKNAHIVFAEIEGISNYDEGELWCKALEKEMIVNGKSFSKLKMQNSENVDFKRVLKKTEKNIVIFNTDKFAYINPFISNLRSATNEFDIILFEQFSWRNQDKIIPQNIFISPFSSKLNTLKLNEFNLNYTKYFGKNGSKSSPRYDLLGYDLSNYFITLMNKYGSKFIEKIGTFHFTTGIQSELQFERISNGSGYVNQKLYLGEE